MKRVTLCLSLLSICNFSLYAQETVVAASGSSIAIASNGSMYVSGGMVLADNSQLTNDGIVTLDKTVTAKADFTDHTTTAYNYGIGKFVFSGFGTQNILSANRFNQIEVNNNGLDLLSDIQSNNWNLKTGLINTNNFYAIAISTNASAVQADVLNDGFTKSWINGNLRRYIDPVKVNNYLFPVGDAIKLNMAEMNDLSANPLKGVQYINASFGYKPGNDRGLNINQYNKTCVAINNSGVWHLVTDAVPAYGNYNLKLYLNGFTGLGNGEYNILQRPDASASAAEWMLPVGNNVQFAGTTDRYISKNNIAVFGQFGIGIITTVAPVAGYTETKNETALKVYPNPVINNEFYVQYIGTKVNSLTLVASDGKIVACNFNLQKADQLKVTLPVFLAKGIYTLRLNTNTGLQSTLINLQ